MSSFRLAILDEATLNRTLVEGAFSKCYNFPACKSGRQEAITNGFLQILYSFESPEVLTQFYGALIADNLTEGSHASFLFTVDLQSPTVHQGRERKKEKTE
jgi:hypothetical protein